MKNQDKIGTYFYIHWFDEKRTQLFHAICQMKKREIVKVIHRFPDSDRWGTLDELFFKPEITAPNKMFKEIDFESFKNANDVLREMKEKYPEYFI